MRIRLFAFFLILLIVAASAHATIRRVARDGTGDFTTIQGAINVCVNGDTVVVRGDQGSYSENATISHSITLLGQGNGCNNTMPTSLNGQIYFLNGSSNAVLEGFLLNVCNSFVIDVQNSVTGVAIRRCTIYESCTTDPGVVIFEISSGGSVEECAIRCGSDNVSAIVVRDHAIVSIRNCMIGKNVASSPNTQTAVSGTTANVSLENNCILGMTVPLVGTGCNFQIDNNIFWDSSWNGNLTGNTVVSSYNAITASMTSFPGSNNITIASNPFVNWTAPFDCSDNLNLTVASALINAGDPGAAHDRDGSRRDPGMYGGPLPYVDSGAPPFPFVTNLFVSPLVPQNGVLDIRSTGRVGRGN